MKALIDWVRLVTASQFEKISPGVQAGPSKIPCCGSRRDVQPLKHIVESAVLGIVKFSP